MSTECPCHPCASEVSVMPYENQAIIGILTGPDAYDGPVKRNIEKLKSKWTDSYPGNDNCHMALLKSQHVVPSKGAGYKPQWNDPEVAKLKDILPKVDNSWRLYIVGHGDWKQTTCGGVDGLAMAQLLIDGGLREVFLISVTACGGAASSMFGSSFASHLHHFLGKGVKISGKEHPARVRTRVYGRISIVGLGEKGDKLTLSKEDLEKYANYQRKKFSSTMPVPVQNWDWVHKRPDSKIVYIWKGDKQEKRVVDYASDYSSRSKLEAAIEVKLKELLEQVGQQAFDDYLRQRGFIYDQTGKKLMKLQQG
jgi:hypothetical protein